MYFANAHFPDIVVEQGINEVDASMNDINGQSNKGFDLKLIIGRTAPPEKLQYYNQNDFGVDILYFYK